MCGLAFESNNRSNANFSVGAWVKLWWGTCMRAVFCKLDVSALYVLCSYATVIWYILLNMNILHFVIGYQYWHVLDTQSSDLCIVIYCTVETKPMYHNINRLKQNNTNRYNHKVNFVTLPRLCLVQGRGQCDPVHQNTESQHLVYIKMWESKLFGHRYKWKLTRHKWQWTIQDSGIFNCLTSK